MKCLIIRYDLFQLIIVYKDKVFIQQRWSIILNDEMIKTNVVIIPIDKCLIKTYKCLPKFKSHHGQHYQKNVSFKSAHACKAIEIARFQQLWLTFNVF